MNRIQIRPLAKLELPTRSSISFADQTATCPPNLLDYSLFIPQHYEARYAYPLIVWLHSDDADHRQLLKLMPQLSTRNFAAVGIGGQPMSAGDGCWVQHAALIDRTAEQIHAAVDHAKLRLNIDGQRIFVAGMGSGGTMALRMAFSFPDWFTGVASLNGNLPCNLQPLANWSRCRKLPVFWAHARKSDSFSETELCQQLKLLHVAGFSVTLRQYPCDDRMNPRVLHDTNAWIMETISESAPSDSIIR